MKAFGLLGLATWGGLWFVRTTARFGPAAPGRQVLDPHELDIARALADTFFPGPPDFPFTGREVQVAEGLDAWLGGLYPDTQLLFRTLLRTLNLAPVLTYGRSFYWLPASRRAQVVEDWRQSDLRLRRAGHQSLSFALNLVYFEDPKVRDALGLTWGCELSGHPGAHRG